MRRIERALISVFDKTGVVEFARGLSSLRVEILATGSTHKLLSANGIPVREVADYTGFPEILDGRVKTLHPRIAGGLLAIRSNPEHMQQAERNQVSLIDLVCVNLYPFAETIRKPGVSFEEVIENIDIGGPSMIRAAAKNFQDVAVLTSPEDYNPVLEGLQKGKGVLDRTILFDLARKAFLCTARYDAQVAQHLGALGAHHVGVDAGGVAGTGERSGHLAGQVVDAAGEEADLYEAGVPSDRIVDDAVGQKHPRNDDQHAIDLPEVTAGRRLVGDAVLAAEDR